jgi:TolB-like protein/DNA-binding winged helix-turn-helix (wHTH) protein/Tfp pilus assembly protein PilF
MPLYEFAGFRLDADKRLLLQRDGAAVGLTPKGYETLAYLVSHSGAVVEKEQMIRAIWPDTAVEENNLTQNISLLRRVLGEGRGERRFIVTVPGRGYQFVAPVHVVSRADGGLGFVDLSIAVLPFVNNSTDPEYDYFADGLADELIHALSRAAGIRVAARTSSFSFKGKQVHLREVAAALGVTFVLEGAVRKSNNRLRITAQLVNAAAGSPVWSERYEREIGSHDLFEIEDEITEAVMKALRLNFSSGPISSRLSTDGQGAASSPKAHELYLKGRFHLFKMTESGIQTGIRYFERAIEENPRYAPAYVGLAHAYRMFGLSLERPPAEVGSKSKTTALQAVAIEETLAEAHAVLAFTTFWYEWDWESAERHFKRALELGPDSADTWWMYAHLRSNLLRHDEALEMVARARALDPLSGLIHAMEGQFLVHAGRTAYAVPRLKEAIDLDPRSRVAHLFAAKAYIEQGLFEEGLREAQISHDLCPTNSSARANVAYAHALAGRRSEATEILAALLELAAKQYVPAFNIAMIYNALGQTGDALTWLERGMEQRVPYMTFLASDPKWKNLRDDPRYLSLLRRLNLPTLWPQGS